MISRRRSRESKRTRPAALDFGDGGGNDVVHDV